jgi:hypothetical protein
MAECPDYIPPRNVKFSRWLRAGTFDEITEIDCRQAN